MLLLSMPVLLSQGQLGTPANVLVPLQCRVKGSVLEEGNGVDVASQLSVPHNDFAPRPRISPFIKT